jgi:protein arginine kinase activator
MLCFLCKKNDATVPLKHVVDGEITDINACEPCAEKHGFNIQLPIPLLTDFLFGVHSEAAQPDPADDSSCPVCHMNRSDFHKASRLGCETCYETFSDDVKILMDNMHMGNRHIGKIPLSRKDEHIAAVRQEIETAEKADDTLWAARLREHIRKTEAQHAD